MSQYVNITARRIAEPVQGENVCFKKAVAESNIGGVQSKVFSREYTHLTFLPHTELFCTFNTTPNSITPVM